MNTDDEAAAYRALFEKYKPSPRDFLLAQMAARLENIEILLIEIAHPKDSKQRVALGERTASDVLDATEAYLEFLCPPQSDGDAPHPTSENNCFITSPIPLPDASS